MSKHGYAGIDRFRIVAALIIVGIHTYPLQWVSEVANFYVIHVLGRVAVPFFLMITGYFVLPRYLVQGERDTKPLMRFIKKTGLVYALATLLYLPISIYAGHYAQGNPLAILARNIVFDGTFYHLWYLPASIIGVLLVYALGRKLSVRMTFAVALLLYIVGLFGDNYFGVIYSLTFVRNAYEVGFSVFSYTRNGVFYAPIFLVMGAAMSKPGNRVGVVVGCVGLVVSLVVLILEGYMLRSNDFSRHTSMYIALLPVMFFLFNLLIAQRGSAPVLLRSVSMWVFILHPLIIIVVRGLARVAGLTHFLVENGLVHFVVVSGVSVGVGFFCGVVHAWCLRYRSDTSCERSRNM